MVCIGALKKLCNDPSLIYSHCQEAKEMEDSLDVDEVSYFWSAGHLKQNPDGLLLRRPVKSVKFHGNLFLELHL